MRIAQVAPLFESVPPHGYGGTERVVSYLTEELVEQGHEVTLFASGDSVTRAQLVAIVPRACGSTRDCPDPLMRSTLRCSTTCSRDASRLRRDPLPHRLPALPAGAALHGCRRLTTLHGRLDLPGPGAAATAISPSMPLVSISDAPAPAAAARALAARPSTTACRATSTAFEPAARRLPRVPRPHLAREARRPRHRDRARRRHAAAASPPRSTRPTATTSSR